MSLPQGVSHPNLPTAGASSNTPPLLHIVPPPFTAPTPPTSMTTFAAPPSSLAPPPFPFQAPPTILTSFVAPALPTAPPPYPAPSLPMTSPPPSAPPTFTPIAPPPPFTAPPLSTAPPPFTSQLPQTGPPHPTAPPPPFTSPPPPTAPPLLAVPPLAVISPTAFVTQPPNSISQNSSGIAQVHFLVSLHDSASVFTPLSLPFQSPALSPLSAHLLAPPAASTCTQVNGVFYSSPTTPPEPPPDPPTVTPSPAPDQTLPSGSSGAQGAGLSAEGSAPEGGGVLLKETPAGETGSSRLPLASALIFVFIIITAAIAVTVKLLLFPSKVPDISAPCDITWNCTFTSAPFYSEKVPVNQTVNITADCGSLVGARGRGMRIVGGSLAVEDQWGWQASLHWRGQHVCGGAIITPRWIITAAHCFIEFDMMLESDWQVVIDTIVVTHGKRYNTLRIYPHPKYTQDTNDYDLSLLLTDSDMRMGDGVRPVCLPAYKQTFPAGSSCWVTGWGYTREGGKAGPAPSLHTCKTPVH
ncbi:uncharacterized protein LOC111197381 [Astyanax mexicanus]|uniref:uncharacterized protein LOC111197381 n=1 Tax=Astyanax mexicanus TaxID=7994 RepID=UPI0020CB4569|nr:uncharacterized protein LOC111197381 [Astyanax mexicanus]